MKKFRNIHFEAAFQLSEPFRRTARNVAMSTNRLYVVYSNLLEHSTSHEASQEERLCLILKEKKCVDKQVYLILTKNCLKAAIQS